MELLIRVSALAASSPWFQNSIENFAKVATGNFQRGMMVSTMAGKYLKIILKKYVTDKLIFLLIFE